MSVLMRTTIASNKPKKLRLALGLFLLFAWGTAWGHGGRHSERVDQRDAGWLTRFDRANLVVWGIPELDEVGRARFKILETLKGLPAAQEIVARPVSNARAKAVGIKPQLIFLFSHEEQDSRNHGTGRSVDTTLQRARRAWRRPRLISTFIATCMKDVAPQASPKFSRASPTKRPTGNRKLPFWMPLDSVS